MLAEARQTEFQAPVNSRHLIPGLDAIRAAAVVMVLLWHFELPISGPLGVMIFFVLSGFLITGILLKEFDKTASISLKRFYARRAFRIFPTFYFCWFLVTALRIYHHAHIGKWEAIGSFFYLTDYIRATRADPHSELHMWISWSLAIEEQFYLLWPALLLFLLRRKVNLAVALSGLILFIWVYRYIAASLFGASGTYIYNAFEMRVDALMVGGLLAVIVSRDALGGLRLALVRSQWLALIPFALLALVSIGETGKYEVPLFFGLLSFSLQPIVVAVLIVQVVHWSAGPWMFLESRWIKFLAQISYALYLYHIVARDEATRLTRGHWIPIGMACAFALAIGSHYWIERPMLKLRDRLVT